MPERDAFNFKRSLQQDSGDNHSGDNQRQPAQWYRNRAAWLTGFQATESHASSLSQENIASEKITSHQTSDVGDHSQMPHYLEESLRLDFGFISIGPEDCTKLIEKLKAEGSDALKKMEKISEFAGLFRRYDKEISQIIRLLDDRDEDRIATLTSEATIRLERYSSGEITYPILKRRLHDINREIKHILIKTRDKQQYTYIHLSDDEA